MRQLDLKMAHEIVKFVSVFLLIIQIEAFVRRDVHSSTAGPNILDSFQKNLDQFRKCLDQSLANVVEDVNVNKIKPALAQVGDSLDKVNKAFEDLTAPSKVAAQ